MTDNNQNQNKEKVNLPPMDMSLNEEKSDVIDVAVNKKIEESQQIKSPLQKNNDLPLTIAIIVGITIVCGAFWWLVVSKLFLPQKDVEIASDTSSVQEDQQQEQAISDEIEAIEKDLNSIDLTDIDKELSNIEQELSSP